MKTVFFVLSILLTTTQSFAVDALAKASCPQHFMDLFDEKEINVTVAFGYDDYSEGLTADIFSFGNFVQTLTAPCKTWDKRMCGFVVTSTGPHVLEKTLFGPDGLPRRVKITTDYSSMHWKDGDNRSNLKQPERSKKVKKMFLDGLVASDVVLYLGHSRDGGGPSFEPPVLTQKRHVDYDYYHTHKKDKNDMLEALSSAPDKNRLLGLLSCNSIRWFSQGVLKASPSTGFVGTTHDITTSRYEEAIPLLERIFSYQCLLDFSIQDEGKTSYIVTKREWQISAEAKAVSDFEMNQIILENLTLQLKHQDPKIREAAYNEIRTFDSKLYSFSLKFALREFAAKHRLKLFFE